MGKSCKIKEIFQKILSYKKEVLLGNLLALSATLLITIIPLFIPILVDELLLQKDHGFILWIEQHLFTSDLKGYLFFILILILILRTLSTLLSIIQSKISVSISKNITYQIRLSLLDHLKNISLKEYEMIQVGAITSKLVTDIETIDGFISTTVSKLIVAVLMLLSSAYILLWIHWQLALFILLTNPIVILFTVKLSRNIGTLKKEENRAIELFQSSLTETLELFHQIRAANKESYFFEKNRKEAETLRQHAVNYGYKSESAQKLSYLVFLTGYEVFRAVSILAVAYSDLSVGLMLAVFSYLWVMVTPIQDIINFQYLLSTAKAACSRIESIYTLKQETRVDEKFYPFQEKKAIAIETKNLTFSYQEKNTILKNINIEIPKASKIALVGASGSGKTTLAHILVGFYPPNKGEILYDGISNKLLPLSTIRENIHLILQHSKLFNDTMLFNLTLGNAYEPEKIEEAIHIAQLEDVIADLKLGLNTRIGKDGIKLSGGQRQRVAIARMILSDPKVVIFDESTSALDVHTETKLFEALHNFVADKTVITIAHRLSTIKDAEFIYVLEEGKIVDSGSPKALLSKNKGYFNSMV